MVSMVIRTKIRWMEMVRVTTKTMINLMKMVVIRFKMSKLTNLMMINWDRSNNAIYILTKGYFKVCQIKITILPPNDPSISF